jgi:hypothetical protein
MNIQTPTTTTPLRARMIADMTARNLGRASQTSHLRACKRFAAWLRRSPETASPDDGLRNLLYGNSVLGQSRILAFPFDVGFCVDGPSFVDFDEHGG